MRSGIAMTILVFLTLQASAENLPALDSGLENQAGLVFSADGKTAYWTAWNGNWGSDPTSPRTIYTSTRRGGCWSSPVVAAFSGVFNDDDPFVSPDGKWLYFVSDRPAVEGGETTRGDIWRFRISGSGVPERLDVSSGAAEYSPVVTNTGALYFASDREGGPGQGDLYRAAPDGERFARPELLGATINSPNGEWNLWVSPDETDMVFEASSRSTNISVPGDLYYSWRTPAGWAEAVPVSRLNTAGSDLLPRLHPDGETLYFTVAVFNGHARVSSTDWRSLRQELR